MDDAELGAFADDTPGHLKKLTSDPDFFGPESYPRRQRDWVGYYVAFVFIFASFVIGTNAISSGNPGYLFGLVESSTGKLCGFEAGVTEKPYLWHPHAGEKGIGGGGELSVCVTECPLARTWVCVDETVANIFADDKTDSETEQGATQVTYNASKHNTPPPGPPPAPPTSDCPSGAYVHSLIDFEPVFMSCLPKHEDEQTISSEEDGDGGGGEATPNTPRDMHFVSALKEVDTPERFIANAVFAEIDSSRWVLLVTMLLGTYCAFPKSRHTVCPYKTDTFLLHNNSNRVNLRVERDFKPRRAAVPLRRAWRFNSAGRRVRGAVRFGGVAWC